MKRKKIEDLKNREPVTREFLDAIYRDFFKTHPGYIETRIIKKGRYKGSKKARPKFYESVAALIEDLYNYRGDVIVGINPRKKKGGKRDAVDYMLALWIDIDYGEDTEKKKYFFRSEAEALQHIGKIKLSPSVIITTGHGFHLYWLLSKPEKIEDINYVEGILIGLQKEFLGDPACATHTSHCLRLPGTWNCKTLPHAVLCDIHSIYPEKRYKLKDFANLRVAKKQAPVKKKPPPKKARPGSTAVEPMTLDELKRRIGGDKQLLSFILNGNTLGKYDSPSEFDMAVVMRLLKRGQTEDEIKRVFSNTEFQVGREALRKRDINYYLNLTIRKAKQYLEEEVEGKFVRMPDRIDIIINQALADFKLTPLSEKVYMVLLYLAQQDNSLRTLFKKTAITELVYGSRGGKEVKRVEDALRLLNLEGFISLEKKGKSYTAELNPAHLKEGDLKGNKIEGRYITLFPRMAESISPPIIST